MREHSRFVQNFLRCHARKSKVSKASIEVFLQNLQWVIRGIRPAFTPEGIALADELMVELIEEVTTLIDSRQEHCKLCILDVEGHKFIVNVECCLRHLKSLSERNEPNTVFVDISREQVRPKVTDYQDLGFIQHACQACLNSLENIYEPVSIKNVKLIKSEKTNLCTLFGCILGYPIVYYFKCGENEDSSQMIHLNVVKIIDNDIMSGAHLLSFSYPACLKKEVEVAFNVWCAKFKGGDGNIIVKQEVIEMPYVVL